MQKNHHFSPGAPEVAFSPVTSFKPVAVRAEVFLQWCGVQIKYLYDSVLCHLEYFEFII